MSYARRNFDGITTISERLQKIICDRFNLSPDAVGVWPSGVDANHFRPRANPEMRKELGLEDKFIVFYHGAVNENRGVIELAEAAQFLDDLPDLRILIVGAGHLWDTLKKVVQKKRLDKVILIPAVPYSQIPDWVAMADLCAIPLPDHLWWHVSSPLKLMEYLSMGKPILLTDIIPHRAIIPDDEDAFYVHESEGEGFAKGIRRAMAERERFSEMRRKGRAKAASELTWEIQAKKLKNYLELVLDNQINRIRPKNI